MFCLWFHFYSRTSYEVRPIGGRIAWTICIFLLTHLLRGATNVLRISFLFSVISTHAPLTRCDSEYSLTCFGKYISTHAPLTRCDVNGDSWCYNAVKFLLTHLLRGATGFFAVSHRVDHFYSRTSYEVRLVVIFDILMDCGFLLTHLLRGATVLILESQIEIYISTHAPLTRCDWYGFPLLRQSATFLLTHLLRGATFPWALFYHYSAISTHAPLTRCDRVSLPNSSMISGFLLTHLLRGATATSSR